MADSRIVVIGMNNPLSVLPQHALWTQPDGCTGHRLWQLASAYTGISEDDWLEGTDRRNLCVGDWDRVAGTKRAAEWTEELLGRTVILLGLPTAVAFRPGRLYAPLEWWRDRDWFELPHPSGLNRWYNNNIHRTAAAIRLGELWHMYRGETDEAV